VAAIDRKPKGRGKGSAVNRPEQSVYDKRVELKAAIGYLWSRPFVDRNCGQPKDAGLGRWQAIIPGDTVFQDLHVELGTAGAQAPSWPQVKTPERKRPFSFRAKTMKKLES